MGNLWEFPFCKLHQCDAPSTTAIEECRKTCLVWGGGGLGAACSCCCTTHNFKMLHRTPSRMWQFLCFQGELLNQWCSRPPSPTIPWGLQILLLPSSLLLFFILLKLCKFCLELGSKFLMGFFFWKLHHHHLFFFFFSFLLSSSVCPQVVQVLFWIRFWTSNGFFLWRLHHYHHHPLLLLLQSDQVLQDLSWIRFWKSSGSSSKKF